MPEATQPTMHADFPRWYREVSVDENRDRLRRRWVGVSSILPTLDRPAIENFLRIIFGAKGGATPEALGNIRQAFKAADEFFDMQGNDREIEVLIGITLSILLERNDDLAVRTALAITTSALNGNRALRLPMDLVASAENCISRISEKNRERPKLQSAKLELPKISFTKAQEKLTTIDAAGIGAVFDASAEAINLTLTSMVGKFNSSIDATAGFIGIQDEELNMLWWILGEYSDGAKKKFGTIPELERPLIFGAELAEATTYLPGPLSIEGLLLRAGLSGDKVLTIPEAVNACDASWYKSFSDGNSAVPLSQPIHFAIQRKLETGDETSWISGWAGSCGIDPTLTFPSLTLGTLFYRERLLSIF